MYYRATRDVATKISLGVILSNYASGRCLVEVNLLIRWDWSPFSPESRCQITGTTRQGFKLNLNFRATILCQHADVCCQLILCM